MARKFAKDVPPGFDVVCVIGRVEFGETGEDSPYLAAFRLIGSHGAPGLFSFPGENGLVTVDVTHEPPAAEPIHPPRV